MEKTKNRLKRLKARISRSPNHLPSPSPNPSPLAAPDGSHTIGINGTETNDLEESGPIKACANPSQSPAPTSATATIYEGFKTALRVIEKSSDIFPPLKSAVGCLLGLTDVLENARQNGEDSTGLENKLSIMLSVLSNSKEGSRSEEAAERIEDLSMSLGRNCKKHPIPWTSGQSSQCYEGSR